MKTQKSNWREGGDYVNGFHIPHAVWCRAEKADMDRLVEACRSAPDDCYAIKLHYSTWLGFWHGTLRVFRYENDA